MIDLTPVEEFSDVAVDYEAAYQVVFPFASPEYATDSRVIVFAADAGEARKAGEAFRKRAGETGLARSEIRGIEIRGALVLANYPLSAGVRALPNAAVIDRCPGRVRTEQGGLMSAVAEHLYETILRALDAIPSDERDGIYVVSLLVYDEEDDPRLLTVTVGFNTEGDVAEVMATMSEFTDAREARWNYAFWRQNELAVVCDSDRDAYGAAIRGAWVQSLVGERPALPTPESDEEELQVTDAFVEALMEVVQRLHRGEVERIFGRPIPLLIHEVEYYDLIADQNLRANPPGVVPDDFVAFCRAE